MDHKKVYTKNGIAVIPKEAFFRPNENVFIHMSSDCLEYVGVPHKHEFIEIVYIVSGSAIHETPTSSYRVSKGDVVVINYDTVHAFYAQESEESFQCYDLMFTLDFFDYSLVQANDFMELFSSFFFYSLFPEEKAIGPDIHLSGNPFHEFGNLFNKIYLEYIGREKGSLELIRVYTMELLIKILRELDRKKTRWISGRQKAVVEQTISFLRDNYRMHITLEEVGMHIFLNKDYLNRIFREEVGIPINTYLQKLRVEEACKLLADTDMSTTEISETCGFRNTKCFYSQFNRLMDMTPGQYRTNTRRKQALKQDSESEA